MAQLRAAAVPTAAADVAAGAQCSRCMLLLKLVWGLGMSATTC
jgi:hypothetical protein